MMNIILGNHKPLFHRLLMGLSIAFLAISIQPASFSLAQTGGGQVGVWSPQQRIPDYDNESFPPFLVADQNRTVYAFNTQSDGNNLQAIFVRKWTLMQGWTPPVDIILSPMAGAPVISGAFFDKTGIIHLVFFAGNEQYGAFFYTKAPANQADLSPAWSKPEIIGDNSLGIGSAFTGDDHGNLFLVYGGKTDGIGLYGTVSTDGGSSWSNPALITLMEDTTYLPNGTQLAVDPQGNLHAVWSEVDPIGIDQVVYYARLDSNHLHWSQPYALARRDPGDYKAAWPSIISYDRSLMVIYQDSNPATRYMRRSFDGGNTWTAPVRLWPHVGEYRWADLLVDSSNTLHVILGNRNGECCHGMWHGVWQGDQWSDLEPIVIGPKTLQFDPSAPKSIIVQGNVLLATWWTDTGGGPRNGVWYSYTVLDAPELPLQPLSQNRPKAAMQAVPMLVTEAPTFTPVPTPTPIPIALNQLGSKSAQGPALDNPSTPVIASLLPVSLLIIVLFIMRTANRRQS